MSEKNRASDRSSVSCFYRNRLLSNAPSSCDAGTSVVSSWGQCQSCRPRSKDASSAAIAMLNITRGYRHQMWSSQTIIWCGPSVITSHNSQTHTLG